ncbi:MULTISPECIES: TetR/AcrR family transcriptional regulator [unclassified Meridianimarinicoccus]|uniref:TetR/AcrR family transcriptional regulator n=1 Tax=unclassified Meridianimarinicoccus TaxID=2923344 RepID=UPI0018670B25|nr:TetR/AcrR family transcriptional regulator [Fluviibacterium sp. MJW13]
MTIRSKSHDRDKALSRARDLFWKQGFHATSLKDIEAALRMHPGSIYAAFGNKETLFRMALERYAQEIAESRQKILDAAPDVLEGLARFVESAHPVVRDDVPQPACFLAKTGMDTGLTQPALRAAILDLLDRSEASFVAIYRQAQAEGALPASLDPSQTARRLQATLTGIGVYAMRPDRREQARDMAADLAREIRAMRVLAS